MTATTVGTYRDQYLNELGTRNKRKNGKKKASNSAGSSGSLSKLESEKRVRVDKHGRVSNINVANIGRKRGFKAQQDSNLQALNEALETLAGLPFDGKFAAQEFAEGITDKADRAITWMIEFTEARRAP